MAQVIQEKQKKENYGGQCQGYSPHKSKHIPRPQPPISDRAWRIARASSSQETAGAAAPKTNTLHAESVREWEWDGGGRKQKGCPECQEGWGEQTESVVKIKQGSCKNKRKQKAKKNTRRGTKPGPRPLTSRWSLSKYRCSACCFCRSLLLHWAGALLLAHLEDETTWLNSCYRSIKICLIWSEIFTCCWWAQWRERLTADEGRSPARSAPGQSSCPEGGGAGRYGRSWRPSFQWLSLLRRQMLRRRMLRRMCITVRSFSLCEQSLVDNMCSSDFRRFFPQTLKRKLFLWIFWAQIVPWFF